MECDDECAVKKLEMLKQQVLVMEQKKKEEELKNQRELAKYQKVIEGKKKIKEKKVVEGNLQKGFLRNSWVGLTTVGSVLLAVVVFFYILQ